MAEPYRTVGGRGEARFGIRGSEFVGHVAPADTVDAAEAFVAAVNDRHPDATHNVPAYCVPADEASGARPDGVMLREWCSDDGEPSGSAGKPALNVLVQRDLRNVVAVVARYYGGTNLGVGGLARAYSRGVTEAVDDAGVVEEVPHERFAARSPTTTRERFGASWRVPASSSTPTTRRRFASSCARRRTTRRRSATASGAPRATGSAWTRPTAVSIPRLLYRRRSVSRGNGGVSVGVSPR